MEIDSKHLIRLLSIIMQHIREIEDMLHIKEQARLKPRKQTPLQKE